ncbi:pre-mRNA 3' end processing protein WDR33 [Striga asiatica]|uniref:Pre-mRNA 3' end processing protein WDR33 n=1 Tax=Striga asiatica TaxID=4170 RepID=A0A5A7QB89_STRAF|nr:pre-mRNA 3' end processing protein WDR33 [Striga asiatica]
MEAKEAIKAQAKAYLFLFGLRGGSKAARAAETVNSEAQPSPPPPPPPPLQQQSLMDHIPPVFIFSAALPNEGSSRTFPVKLPPPRLLLRRRTAHSLWAKILKLVR